MDIVPSDAALGAEIRDLDLSLHLSEEQVVDLHTALLDHGVLVFRDQHITDEDQVRFTRYFGPPVEHVRKQRQRRVKEIFYPPVMRAIARTGYAGFVGHEYSPKADVIESMRAAFETCNVQG